MDDIPVKKSGYRFAYTTVAVQMPKQVQPDDDAVEYVEKDEPVCTCDIKELTLGQGHDPKCPHYKGNPDAGNS